ncbi:MAG: ATP-binding cassette domain-containing protein [Polyangiales bacterium]
MIRVRDFSVRLGHRLVLDSVSLEWPRGLLAVVGANGSGKSTLLRAIIGAIDHGGGEVEIDGRSLARDRDELQRRCAIVPEEPSYPEHLTVNELVELCAGLRRSEVPQDERSRATIELIGAQRYRTLSLGQRKRAHLLMARVESPRGGCSMSRATGSIETRADRSSTSCASGRRGRSSPRTMKSSSRGATACCECATARSSACAEAHLSI